MLIRVIDLETTGFEPPEASVCEIGFCDLVSDGEGLQVGPSTGLLVNPGHPIPPATSAVHHIVDADVADAESFKEVARSVFRADAGRTILVAHNARFERQWLTPEVTGPAEWICTYKAALRLWPDAPEHKNGTLRYWLNPKGLVRDRAEPAHRAGPDAYVTAFLLREMLAKASIDELIQWSSVPALLVRCTFGKHRGSLWRDVPSDYLRWCAGQQMDEDVAFTVRHEMRRREGAR